jgi:hypothetical protein
LAKPEPITLKAERECHAASEIDGPTHVALAFRHNDPRVLRAMIHETPVLRVGPVTL